MHCHGVATPQDRVEEGGQRCAAHRGGGLQGAQVSTVQYSTVQYSVNILMHVLVRFHIHSVKREDRGTYFCVADNGVGKAKKRHVALEVGTFP